MDDQHGQRTLTAGLEGSAAPGTTFHGRHGNNSLRTLGSGRLGTGRRALVRICVDGHGTAGKA